MVCGLFSSFDPTVFLGSGVKWFFLSFFLFMGWKVFVKQFGLNLFVVEGYKLVLNQLLENKTPRKMVLMLVSVFVFFLSVNLGGLLSWFFSLSSHLVFNLAISFPLWLSGLVFSFSISFNSFFSHMVPLGSPVFLWPLLVCVETVSLTIRPVTLAVRLMANMMAGHLIMSLLASSLASSLVLFPLSSILMALFLIFESGVSLVQSFVFMLLISLYWDE